MRTVFVAAGVLLISGCATTAMPNYVNGNYYMGGDAACARYRVLSDTRIMCMDKNGTDTGYRDAMTPEQMQMYNMQQQQMQSQAAPQIKQQTVSCKKWGDFSGQIYQFASSICPVGYY